MVLSLGRDAVALAAAGAGQPDHRAGAARVSATGCGRRIFPATWDAQQREGDVIQIVDEAVNGVRVVKAFGQEDRELRAGRRRLRGPLRLADARRPPAPRATSRCCRRSRPFGQVAILAFGGWLALHGDITLGTFLAFSTYVGQLVAPTRQLPGCSRSASRRAPGSSGSSSCSTSARSIADAPDAVELADAARRDRLRRRRASATTAAPVLDGFDLTSRAGERVAIVGPSGSGKIDRDAARLALLRPDRGAVLVDGHDVRGLHAALAAPPDRRRLRGELPLLATSSATNIAYGRPGASDAEIEAAARVAQAHDFIARAAARLRHRRRRARPHAVRRPAAADRAGPGVLARPRGS